MKDFSSNEFKALLENLTPKDFTQSFEHDDYNENGESVSIYSCSNEEFASKNFLIEADLILEKVEDNDFSISLLEIDEVVWCEQQEEDFVLTLEQIEEVAKKIESIITA